MSSWLDYGISQGFGPTDEPLDSGYGGYAHFNKGWDVPTPLGTPITAIAQGQVIQAGPGSDGWGTSVKVQTPDGTIVNYGHLSGVSVNVGDAVGPGMVIGQSGNSGNSTGPHLSLDIWQPSASGPQYIDPAKFIGGQTVTDPAQQYDEFGFPINGPAGGGATGASPVLGPPNPATNQIGGMGGSAAAPSDNGRITLDDGSYLVPIPNQPGKYALYKVDPITGQAAFASIQTLNSQDVAALGPAPINTTIVGADGKEHRVLVDRQGNVVKDLGLSTAPGAATDTTPINTTIIGSDGKEHRVLVDKQGNIIKDLGVSSLPAGAAKPSAIQSVFNALPGAQGAYTGNTSSGTTAGGGSTGGSSAAPAASTGSSSLAPGFNGQQYDPNAPAPGYDAAGQQVENYGMNPGKTGFNSFLADMASQGQGRSQLNSAPLISAAGGKPTFDPATDAATAAGIEATRAQFAAQGFAPAQIQSMLDSARFGDAPNRNLNYGMNGNPNVGGNVAPSGANFSYAASGPTPPSNGKGPIPFDSKDYQDWLKSLGTDTASYADGGGFNTSEPVIMMGAISKKPLAFIGGTGQEQIDVTPKGPHGSPAMEARVGSQMWPGLTGARPYANGTSDILNDPNAIVDYRNGDPSASMTPTVSPPGGGTATPDYSSMNGGREPDYISKSMEFPDSGSFNNQAADVRRYSDVGNNFQPRLTPEDLYNQRVAQGWAGPSVSTFEPQAQLNDAFIRWTLSHLNDPIGQLPANEIAKLMPQFVEDPGIVRGRMITRNPSYYGYNADFIPQADGGTNTAGTSYMANGGTLSGGLTGMDQDGSDFQNLMRFEGLNSTGLYPAATAAWDYMTPAAQARVWGTLNLPGMGTPWNGGYFAPKLTYSSMYNGNGYTLANDSNLAATPAGTYAELQPGVYQPPKDLNTFMHTPVNQNPAWGGAANNPEPAPRPARASAMADGGMGMAGGMGQGPMMGGMSQPMPQPMMGDMRQTDPMLLAALSAGIQKRIRMTLPVAA